MSTHARVAIGPLTLIDTGVRRPHEAETTKKRERSTGVARILDVVGPGVDVEIADITFDNGKRDVRMLNRRAVIALDRLVHGLRVGVHRDRGDRWFVELRVPALGTRQTSTQHRTDIGELNDLCAFDIKNTLVESGAVAVSRREQAIGDSGRRRNELCAVFDHEDSLIPAVAYAITPLFSYLQRFPPP